MSIRVGIFGGMFDPIHIGHCILAEHFIEQAKLHVCYLIPAYQSPLRADGGHATPYQRLQMAQIVARTNPRLRALDIEIQRKDISYTIKTIEYLRVRRPSDQFYMVIGADQVAQFTQWHRWQDILRQVVLVVAPRPGVDLDATQKELERHGGCIIRLNMPLISISSSMIRQYRLEGRSIRYMVHDHVHRYIRRHRLYALQYER
ncbi:MAG: nicotinate (nicotinamide) nucleotide adenylyltransferase [Chlorobi bacterium]|nr:nicotinate (nicotinamide) nucleotide adenylyltransferase [Chlorobiota bacterium]